MYVVLYFPLWQGRRLQPIARSLNYKSINQSINQSIITPCPEILLESVTTQTYRIYFTVYSIGAVKITKIAPAILDSFFKWSTVVSRSQTTIFLLHWGGENRVWYTSGYRPEELIYIINHHHAVATGLYR